MDLLRVCWFLFCIAYVAPCSYAYRSRVEQIDEQRNHTLSLLSDARGSISMKTSSIGQALQQSLGIVSTPPMTLAPRNISDDSAAIPKHCKQFRSFIISVNSEFVEYSANHVMSMLVDALQPALNFDTLPEKELNHRENWKRVADHLTMRSIDILIFACQECSWHEETPKIMAEKDHLGEHFHFDPKNEYRSVTMTKGVKPRDGLGFSYLYIAALTRKETDCPVKKISTTTTVAKAGNKGAAMIYVKTAANQNIAFVGAHLDAHSEDSRLDNIKKIMRKLRQGHKVGQTNKAFDHVYIFGDLNYRLLAPSTVVRPERCLSCVSGEDNSNSSGCSGGEVEEKCKWCYEQGKVDKGTCVPQKGRFSKGTSCSDLITNAKAEKAVKLYQCRQPSVDMGSHLQSIIRMINEKSTGLSASMYQGVQDLDTLRNNLHVWNEYGQEYLGADFVMPMYSTDVPPTYKVAYKKSNQTAKLPSENWYEFQSLLEQWPDVKSLLEQLPELNDDELKQKEDELNESFRQYKANLILAAVNVYQKVEKMKSCEYAWIGKKRGSEKCMDFGWLDRLMILQKLHGLDLNKNSTIVEIYQTLKMHNKYGFGDHSPIFMQLLSTQ